MRITSPLFLVSILKVLLFFRMVSFWISCFGEDHEGPWSLNCIMSRAKFFLDFQLFLYYINVINNILLFWTSSLIPFVIPLQQKTWKNNFKHQFKYLFPGFSMPFQLFPRIFSSVCFSPYFQYLPYNHNIVVCLSGSMFTRWKRKLPWFSLAWS